jgi:hypothetical protein
MLAGNSTKTRLSFNKNFGHMAEFTSVSIGDKGINDISLIF